MYCWFVPYICLGSLYERLRIYAGITETIYFSLNILASITVLNSMNLQCVNNIHKIIITAQFIALILYKLFYARRLIITSWPYRWNIPDVDMASWFHICPNKLHQVINHVFWFCKWLVNVIVVYSQGTCSFSAHRWLNESSYIIRTRRAKFMGPAWDPHGSCRPQMGPMWTPWTLLSGYIIMSLVLEESGPLWTVNHFRLDKRVTGNFQYNHNKMQRGLISPINYWNDKTIICVMTSSFQSVHRWKKSWVIKVSALHNGESTIHWLQLSSRFSSATIIFHNSVWHPHRRMVQFGNSNIVHFTPESRMCRIFISKLCPDLALFHAVWNATQLFTMHMFVLQYQNSAISSLYMNMKRRKLNQCGYLS